MTLPPGRFDYAPINDRPIITWPNNARVAFWVAPNMEFFEYLPENRPTQPDIPHYSRMDYGNRVGFWRMLDVLNKHKLRACCCLNLEILDHFPEIKDAMVAADWLATVTSSRISPAGSILPRSITLISENSPRSDAASAAIGCLAAEPHGGSLRVALDRCGGSGSPRSQR